MVDHRTRRDHRRDEATARNEQWRALPLKERFAIVMSRRGESRRERERLETLIAREEEA